MNEQMSGGLRIEPRGPALWLILDRPKRRNALTLGLATALADALSELPDGVRAAVVTGTPPAFCSGGDIGDLVKIADEGPLALSDVVYGKFHGLVNAIANTPVPVIAAVNGPALGGGFDLALWCDLRAATTEATFASSWINLGFVPGMGGAHQLTRIVGATRAAELVLLGRPIDAHVALQWGLVNAVVAPGDLDAYVADLVDTLAKLSPAAVSRSKAALRRVRDAGAAQELATLGAVQGTLITGPEFRAATERFRES